MSRARWMLTEAGRAEAVSPAEEIDAARWHREYRVHAHDHAEARRTTYGQIISHRHEEDGAIRAEFPRRWAQQLRDAAARLEIGAAAVAKPHRGAKL